MKLTDMITLGVICGSSSGTVRKMLHAPSLQIMAIKEVPLWSKEVRHRLVEWMNKYQSVQNKSDRLCHLYNSYWNTPEGCVTILMDHCNANSLQNLLESMGSLPEYALRMIVKSAMKGLTTIHNLLNEAHGHLRPSQILFEDSGKIKLSFGIAHRLLKDNASSIVGIKCSNSSL